MLAFFLVLVYNANVIKITIINFEKEEVNTMKKYVCDPCGYEYDPAVGDPDNGIAAGTAVEDLPEDWVCPICGAGKEEFKAVD